MFPGCPLCNGVETPGLCPSCGSVLEDLGMVENFYGPYSPYEEGDSHTCVHLIYCPNCQNDFHRRETVGETANFYQHTFNSGETK